ncbi:MAG TPA: hypothetical protein VGK19_16030 [Capsulimonadaceae bacterium]|jgi:hypothetical protein
MNTLFPTIIASLLALMALCVPASPAAAQEKPVNVLILTASRMKLDTRLQDELSRDGIHFVSRNLGDPLSMEILRQFHVAVIADWEGPTTMFFPRGFVSDSLTTRRNTELLLEYVKAGGGFFFSPMNGTEGAAEALSRLLAPFGAGVMAAQVRDDAHAFADLKPVRDEAYTEYAWTTNVAKHPATKGVERVYYPTSELRWDNLYSTPVITLQDPSWVSLVKGMDSSSASKGTDYSHWRSLGVKAPPIAAVRQFGSGRVGLWAPGSLYTFSNPYDNPSRGWILEAHTGRIDGVMMEKGDGVNPSHGRKLLGGMLRWLADGARAQGMGGYTEASYTALKAPDKVPAPGWLYSWKQGDGNTWFKLLIGARSSFSDGKGTIAEYATAAKAAGVSMLYMTETFEKFDPARWDEYRAACAKVSDDKLKVVAGLDLKDTEGNRYLLLGSPVFPAPSLLTADGKAIAKPQYLCLCFPKGITVQHRASTTPVPHELEKHFQAMSLYTYRDGKLADNSLPAYQWQVFRLSNPLPVAVHETYEPAAIATEAATGHQVYGSAINLEGLAWYLGEHGTSHFWESPVRLQVSSGPMITNLGGASTDPEQPSVSNAISFSVEGDEPLKEVALWENFNLYRRWKPSGTKFTINNVKLPEGHVNWLYVIATDAKGRQVVSPGVIFGKQVVHTWRCADRQNWWQFSNLYTGCEASGFDVRVPSFEAAEGSSLFPEITGSMRGDNMAPMLDFALASPAVYIQDVFIDQRYFQAQFWDVSYDAKPSRTTTRSRFYEAKIRYERFYPAKIGNTKVDFFPERKTIEITLRKPTLPTGDVFPVITTLQTKHGQVRGDMTFAYTDAKTGKAVTGTLSKGYLDLPKGGRVGGFIALSDGIRVNWDGTVGFAPPTWVNGSLPIGTTWSASFVTVPPAEGDKWRNLMGLTNDTPYKVTVTKGQLSELAYTASYVADGFRVEGSVDKAVALSELSGMTSGLVNNDKEALGVQINEYRLPVIATGVNYNWPAYLVRGGELVEEIPVFEGKAYARLDVTQTGRFMVGNVVQCDSPNLKIGLLRWAANAVDVEINNPTDKDIETDVWTVGQAGSKLTGHVSIRAGTSSTAKLIAVGG